MEKYKEDAIKEVFPDCKILVIVENADKFSMHSIGELTHSSVMGMIESARTCARVALINTLGAKPHPTTMGEELAAIKETNS